MQIHHYTFAGILIASAIGLSACDNSGDPSSTGSTNAPAMQSDEAPAQAIPAPDENTPTDGTNTGG